MLKMVVMMVTKLTVVFADWLQLRLREEVKNVDDVDDADYDKENLTTKKTLTITLRSRYIDVNNNIDNDEADVDDSMTKPSTKQL